MNQWDSQNIVRSIAGRCDIVDFGEEADVYVVNTCTVTAGSDSQARRLIRRTIRLRPGAKVLVTGCYAERAGEELSRIDGVADVIGNSSKERLAEILGEYVGGCAPGPVPGPETGRSRAHVAVQRGCDRRCTYCVVPSVRGPARSFAAVNVISQVETLVQSGYKEIVLTGTYLGDYGSDPAGGDLADLIVTLDRVVDGRARLRISSLGPTDITERFLESVSRCRNVCRHFHVAFQSGDDGVLRSMGRGHGRRAVRRALDLISETFTDCGLGGDVMVGFPGEDEGAFGNTVSVVEEYPFSHLHVFMFSPRPGTPACKLHGRVDPMVAAGRSSALRGLGAAKGKDFARRFIGRRVSVVAESEANEPGNLKGTSDEYLRVVFEGDRSWKGRLFSIDVEGALSARTVRGRAAVQTYPSGKTRG